MPNSENLVALALSLRRQGDFVAAREAAQRALDENPRDPAAWFNLGASLAGLGEVTASEAAYRRALQLRPDYAEAWSNLGGLLGSLGRQDEAIAAYRRGIGANNRLAPIWSNLANALCMRGSHAEAEEASRNSLALDPNFAPAWVNLGRVLQELRRFPEARDACTRATALAPALADAWVGLANALVGMKAFEQVVRAYERAVDLQPGNSDLHANLGVALRRVDRPDEAMASMRRALELDSGNAYASWNLANWLLADGKLAEGWQHYESRWSRAGAPPLRYPPKGGFPAGDRILLWAEQGVGDEILYGSMVAEVAARGADVTIEVDPRLVPLFRRSLSDVTVRARSQVPEINPDHYDHVLPLGGLPRWLRSSWPDFPRRKGYLVADSARAAVFRRGLQQAFPRLLIVGVAWRSANPELGVEKSASLEEWQSLLSIPGVKFVSLQYGAVAEECRDIEQRFGTRVETVPGLDLMEDLDGLAALQASCDLVITISNVNAHISGALGRPGWVLLPKRLGRLWYWFHGDTHSLWYPSLTLIPQSRDGEWASAIGIAADRLRAMLADKS